MEKRIKLLPLFLILFFLIIVARSNFLDDYTKLGILVFIIIIGNIVFFRKYKNGEIKKESLYIFIFSLILTLVIFLYSYFKIN